VKLIFVPLSIVLILGCTVTGVNPVNNPPNPPVLPLTVVSVSSFVVTSLNFTYSVPPDPDSGDIVHMEIVEIKIIDSDGVVTGDVPADLAANANVVFADATAGDFEVTGLTAELLVYAWEFMGVFIRTVDSGGLASSPVMLRLQFAGS